MGSLKRLQHICKTIESSYTELIYPNASTLFISYIEIQDLKNINLPNIEFSSPFKTQTNYAEKLGLRISGNSTKKYEIVITSVPKSREEALGQIAKAFNKTKFGGIVVLEGNNHSGVTSILKLLSGMVDIDYQTSRAHG